MSARRLAVSLALVTVGALRTAATPARPVTYIPADKVKAAFVKGMPLVEVENYKIHASHREAGSYPVEVHTKDTDIMHVLSGKATLVTGGTMVGGKETAPEEIRGTSIEGGETRAVSPGDVVIIPNGTPHWFKDVPGPIDYYVVKVRAQE